MRIIVGTILYKSDPDILLKNIRMLSRQTLLGIDKTAEVNIIILDNDMGGQLREVREAIEKDLPADFCRNVTYIDSENIGFGAGHNKIFSYAADKSDFDYYLCMNPDGIPDRRMLDRLVSFARKNNDRGVFEARQFPVEHPKVYDPVTGRTGWCSGCCLMFPKAVFDKLGGFDDFFFMYMEDVDISWRTRLLGYDCYTVHDALFSHFIDEGERDVKGLLKSMFISGYKLGCKYKDSGFRRFCLKRLAGLLTEEEIAGLEHEIKKKKAQYGPFKVEKFMNFRTGFHFSAARW